MEKKHNETVPFSKCWCSTKLHTYQTVLRMERRLQLEYDSNVLAAAYSYGMLF